MGRYMFPVVTKTWTYTERHFSVVWKLFGVRIFGRTLYPWQIPPIYEWKGGNGRGFHG